MPMYLYYEYIYVPAIPHTSRLVVHNAATVNRTLWPACKWSNVPPRQVSEYEFHVALTGLLRLSRDTLNVGVAETSNAEPEYSLKLKIEKNNQINKFIPKWISHRILE